MKTNLPMRINVDYLFRQLREQYIAQFEKREIDDAFNKIMLALEKPL